MLSLTSLQHNLNSLMQLSTTDGINVKFVYKGRIYLMVIEPTLETYNRNLHRRLRKQKANIKKGITLVTQNCLKCGSVVVADICINKSCEANQKPKTL